MNFTKEDIQTIKDALRTTGVKDSEFLEATLPLSKTDGITLLQEGKNKKITIGDFNNQMLSLFRLDFINLTEKYSIEYVSLEEAVSSIPSSQWREGLVITFYNNEKQWKIYQFIGDINQFTNPTLWKDLFDVSQYVINSYLPDEEDITASLPDDNGNSKLSLKDKLYDPTNFSGMGTKIIRKNIIEVAQEDGTIKRINYLSQDEFNSENTIYIIKYDFTLNENITIPANCVLKFDGGSISNGTLKLSSNCTVLNMRFNRVNDFVDMILIDKCNNVVLQNCYLNGNKGSAAAEDEECRFSGIRIQDSYNVKISGCTIKETLNAESPNSAIFINGNSKSIFKKSIILCCCVWGDKWIQIHIIQT